MSGHIPASILPGDGVVLISPVALLTAVETRVDGEELRRRLLAHGLDGLLSVEIENAITVHEMSSGEIVFDS